MMANALFIVFGMFLTATASWIIIRHEVIWNCSLKHYNAPDSRFLDILKRPNKLSYSLNVFLIWPLIALIGLMCIYMGLGRV